MSLDENGFEEEVVGGQVVIEVDNNHKLLKLARSIPWQQLLAIISIDIKKTSKGQWWRGRPLRLRIHLGVYIIQQLDDFTDEQLEEQIKSNAVYQLFCGKTLVDKWHCPDHTKIATFRNRILPDTHWVIANIITKHAVKLGFAYPKHLDIDSTIQQANVKYPNMAGLLKSISIVAYRLANELNKLTLKTEFKVDLSKINTLILEGYLLKKQKSASPEQYNADQRRLWEVVYEKHHSYI